MDDLGEMEGWDGALSEGTSPQLSSRSRVDRHPVWRDAGSQMAPNCPRGPPRTISQGFGHWPPLWARLSCFLFYPSTYRASRVGHGLGIARGGAGNWCPRRALGPMNSAWAKGRGRRAALWRAAAFVRVSSDCGRQSCRRNIALRRTAAATGSNGCCHYTSYSRTRRRHFLAPAVLLGREPSPTPPRVGFSGVPQHAARAGERPPRQTDSCCNYPTS